ncbi:MAG: vitamin B12 dependent-methionine synthase activation domain-containing protein [Bacteroidota bacterium]
MKKVTFQFDFRDLKLTVHQLESAMGYKEGESPEVISDLVADILKEAASICKIRAEYRIFENISYDDIQKTIKIKNLIFDIKKIIYGQIKKSDAAALFLCTAGEEIGLRSRKSMKDGDLLKGYVYDVVGSEAVEAAADLMQDHLEVNMKCLGSNITNRFSPGYCGWMVVEQHKLFSLMPDNYCGIRLNESALMDPVKSVSGIIGIGKNVRRAPYTCRFCDMKDCIYRRTKA